MKMWVSTCVVCMVCIAMRIMLGFTVRMFRYHESFSAIFMLLPKPAYGLLCFWFGG